MMVSACIGSLVGGMVVGMVVGWARGRASKYAELERTFNAYYKFKNSLGKRKRS